MVILLVFNPCLNVSFQIPKHPTTKNGVGQFHVFACYFHKLLFFQGFFHSAHIRGRTQPIVENHVAGRKVGCVTFGNCLNSTYLITRQIAYVIQEKDVVLLTTLLVTNLLVTSVLANLNIHQLIRTQVYKQYSAESVLRCTAQFYGCAGCKRGRSSPCFESYR